MKNNNAKGTEAARAQAGGGLYILGGFCSPGGKPKSGHLFLRIRSACGVFGPFGQWITGRIEGKLLGNNCAAGFRTWWHACAISFEAELLRERSDESGSMVMHWCCADGLRSSQKMM